MRKSITQEFDYGCGIACYAFVLQITYNEAAKRLGKQQAVSNRFYVKDLRIALNAAGLSYTSSHSEGTIVLIRRSLRYSTGHYLVRHDDCWMDPWINLPACKDITKARSGFRKRLQGSAMYALQPYQM